MPHSKPWNPGDPYLGEAEKQEPPHSASSSEIAQNPQPGPHPDEASDAASEGPQRALEIEATRSQEISATDETITPPAPAPIEGVPQPESNMPSIEPAEEKLQRKAPPFLEPQAPRSQVEDIFREVGRSLDSNSAGLFEAIDGARGDLRRGLEEILGAVSRDEQLTSRLQQVEQEKIQLLEQISQLRDVESQFASLVPPEVYPLLTSIDEDRKRLVHAMLHLLSELSGHVGSSPQLIAELAQALGSTLHRNPQPPIDVLSTGADALNGLLKRNDAQISVRCVRPGDAIEPAFMDGPELQGRRIVAEVKNWAISASDRVVRKAQITGK